MNWLKKLVLVLLLSCFPSIGHADFEDILAKFRPRITVGGDYTDNLNLTKTDKKEDFITTISPGITISATEPKEVKYGLNLDYRLGMVFYAHTSENNYVSHIGTLNTWYTFGRRLTLRLWDYVLRSDEPLEQVVTISPEPGVYYLTTQRKRFIYDRNTLEPSLNYQFGREDQFSINYRNIYYQSENPLADNSRGNYIIPRLTYWFNINNGIILEYGFSSGNFDLSPDFTGHRARARYTYRFNPQTSIFGEYIYDTLHYESPGISFYVQSPSIGITHAFSPTLNGRAQVGYFVRTPETGDKTEGASMDVGLTQRTQQTTYGLSLQGGYLYSFFTAANVGFTRYYRGIGYLRHQLAARLFTDITGTLERNEFTDQDRTDTRWIVSGSLSYQFLKWLTASFRVSYRDNNSNQDIFNYQEFRGMIMITAGYTGPIFSPGSFYGGGMPW